MKKLKGSSRASMKKKHTLVIASLSLVVLTIGCTIAYNQNQMFFANLFRLQSDEMEFTETFDSPDDWQPCQTVPKTASVKNNNATPRYVRMKYNEYWRVKDSQTPTTDHETTDLPLTWTAGGVTKHYVDIDTQNEDKWELKSDGWYYYKTAIQQNESTDSYFESVTFNCEVNLAGEMRYSADGLVGEVVPSDYADASYHIYITFQTSDVEYEIPQHTADCDGNVLYDTIACMTNGPDDHVNFRAAVSVEDGNGNGVNTLSAHKDDYYPVYYFRGEVDNNYVLFANRCWKVLRTTGTGGVKLVYGGPSANGECLDLSIYPNGSQAYASTSVEYSSYTMIQANDGYAPHLGGYMFDPTLTKNARSASGYDVYMGRDAVWDGSKYILKDVERITGHTYQQDETYRYYCPDFDATECTEVVYILDYGYYMHNRYLLRGGKFYEDYAHGNVAYAGARGSAEGWLGGSMASYVDQLEDTVWCNDRSYDVAALKSGLLQMEDMSFNVRWRNEYNSQKADQFGPSIDCEDPRDRFTVSEENGNGALSYPVGLITADEATLAGMQKEGTYQTGSKNFLYTALVSNGCTFTMSPYEFRFSEFAYCTYLYDKSTTTSSNRDGRIQPLVSLKEGTTYTSGDGTRTNPWVIGQ